MKKCVRCGKEAEIIIEIDEYKSGLPVQTWRYACRKCAEETGVDTTNIVGFVTEDNSKNSASQSAKPRN